MVLEKLDVCPICGQRNLTDRLTTTDFTVTRETFTIQQCDSCGFQLTNPRPPIESIGKYYQSSNYISHTGGTNGIVDRLYRQVRKHTLSQKLSLVNSYQSKLNLLDYGCGTGNFLEVSKDAGWTATGIEPSKEARSIARKDLDIKDSLDQINDHVNAITLWHVLEHVHNLNDTLAKLRSLLTNNGTIFLAVPNRESPDAKYYDTYWAGYDVPRHLWHFNKENIRTLLTRHNLKLHDIQPMKFDAFYVSLLSEQYKSPETKLKNYCSAFYQGLRSNLRAGTDNYSSLIYIAGT